jgi:hypothetical protein
MTAADHTAAKKTVAEMTVAEDVWSREKFMRSRQNVKASSIANGGYIAAV